MLFTPQDNEKLTKIVFIETGTKHKTELVDTEYMEYLNQMRDRSETEYFEGLNI
jgi:hypothetical protein|tara:strand:+ start:13670 stop:13831 length:162 start_codon:yes stop_codon:yes gene_type:complete